MAHVDLGIVIVSWNVKDLLRRCLQSVEASLHGSSLSSRIVVVDNASQDGTPQMVKDAFLDVHLIENSSNRGFARGSNDGMRALGLLSPETRPRRAPRYLLLLNPDTEVVGDAIPHMVHYLETHPEVIVVGPQLRYGNGTLQSSRRRRPGLLTLFWESTLLEQWWPHNPWAVHYRFEERPAVGEQQVDWLVGAALLVRATTIDRVGGLDEGFFMYSEELEWQERLTRGRRAQRGRIVYLPGAIIIHDEGRSSEQNLLRRHIDFNRSKLRYTRLRFGPTMALLLRTFLLASYLVQTLIEASKWVLGHKRRLRAARVRQYLQIVASGL